MADQWSAAPASTVDDDVAAMLERLAHVTAAAEGVVTNERDTVFVSHLGDPFEVWPAAARLSARRLEDLPRGQQLLPQDSERHVLNRQLSHGGQSRGDPSALPERHPRELQTY